MNHLLRTSITTTISIALSFAWLVETITTLPYQVLLMNQRVLLADPPVSIPSVYLRYVLHITIEVA